MSQLLWKKLSAAVGLAGLTPREAVSGALTWPEFQLMPDPLDSDPFGKLIVKGEVSAVLINYFYSVFKVEHVGQILVYNNLILQVEDVEREDMKSWFEISKEVEG